MTVRQQNDFTLQSHNNRYGEIKLSSCSNNSLGYDITAHDTTKDVNKSSMHLKYSKRGG